MTQIERVRTELDKRKDRSVWERGITAYAYELLDNVEKAARDGRALNTVVKWKEAMLNGAQDWIEYSYGGKALIYDEDIAKRICTSSELKRNRNGELKPNSRELWLDAQARALFRAQNRIIYILRYEMGMSY